MKPLKMPPALLKSLIREVSYYIILKMAIKIKDLFANSGNRFKKINTDSQ